jgi:hypothetical protein
MGSRFSLKGSTLRILASGVVGLALVSGAATSILAQHSSSTASASTHFSPKSGAAIKGSFRSGVVDLTNVHAATTSSTATQTAKTINTNRSRQTPAQLAAYREWALSHTGSLPKATSATAAKAGANTYGNGVLPVLVSKGAGMSSADVAAAHGGAYYIPPDQALAVSPGYIFEGVNNLMEVYSWTYAKKYGPWTPEQLFAPVMHTGAGFSDPQITYDAERNRYIIAWLEIYSLDNGAHFNDAIDIAISKTSTPAPTNFRVYQMPATVFGSDVFCDYPTLGYDYWGMYVTCVSFAVSNGAWLGNNTLALSINNLISGAGASGWWWGSVYTDVSCGSSCFQPAFRISPTIEDGVPQAEWVTAIDESFGVVTSTQVVCAITNTVLVNGNTTSPTYTCTGTTLPLPYDDPIGAAQPGTGSLLYPGEGYKQVAYRNGQLYFAFPMDFSCSGNNHVGIYWGAITPQLTTKAVNNPQHVNGVVTAYSQAGYWCFSDADSYLPTLIADTEGDMTLMFTVSSSAINPSIMYTGRTAADAPGSMGQGGGWAWVLGGLANNTGGRWGDYSACALSTNMVTRGVVFCANEIMNGATSPAWNTELYQIRMQ